MRAGDDQVDDPLVAAVGDDPLQGLADAGGDLLRVGPAGDRLADDRLDVRVPQDREGAPEGRRQLGRDAVRVVGVGEPGAEAAADADRAQPLSYDLLGEEVLADELAEGDAQLVLLGGDDRGVRDGQARGWRKRAVTANQSAIAPTMPASAAAAT